MLGQALGLTEAEFEALSGDYRNSPLFTSREKAAIRWAEVMTLNTAKHDEDAWAEMRRHFTDAEIVEISMASGLFNMANRLNDAFRTELEPEEYNRRQHGALGTTEQMLLDYACRICGQAGSVVR